MQSKNSILFFLKNCFFIRSKLLYYCIAVLYVLPSMAQLVVELYNMEAKKFISTTAISCNFLNALNLATIFFCRQPDVRSAMKASLNSFVAGIKKGLCCTYCQFQWFSVLQKPSVSPVSSSQNWLRKKNNDRKRRSRSIKVKKWAGIKHVLSQNLKVSAPSYIAPREADTGWR